MERRSCSPSPRPVSRSMRCGHQRLPVQSGLVDVLRRIFAGLVLLYASSRRAPSAAAQTAARSCTALRHDLVPVVAFLIGRSLGITAERIRSVLWTLLGVAAAVAGFGLVEEYTTSVGWWHRSGAVGYFRHQLGFDYHGPGGMPENFAFNTGHNHLFRRLISTFISPLGAAYMFVVALLAAPMRRLAIPIAVLVFAGLLFTISRSALTGLVAGLIVLALARREWWPLAVVVIVAGAGIGFDRAYQHVAPTTHFLPAELKSRRRTRASIPARRQSSSTSTSRPGGATCPASATG